MDRHLIETQSNLATFSAADFPFMYHYMWSPVLNANDKKGSTIVNEQTQQVKGRYSSRHNKRLAGDGQSDSIQTKAMSGEIP